MEPGYDIDKRLSESISLYIPNATYARGGRYECHVIGEGNRADPCELEINGKPDPPYDITVSNSTDESFTVCWTPAYDKGLQQGFRVLYRPAGSRDNYTAVDVCPPSANCFRVNVFYIHKKKRKTGSTTDPKPKKNPGHYEAYLPMSQREKHQYDTPCVSADPENGISDVVDLKLSGLSATAACFAALKF
ncbi:hypothetical protein BaRGS_00013406 [Batillaria attramentaria]|uniref:Fibronectin type-III domain-containing protein n=1 Tax=Batillaria attramentaria TaxID=370345 RepID=A0ABD0L7L9_9CAEN